MAHVRDRSARRLGELFLPGGTGAEVELAQRGLRSIGFDVAITGVYDSKTSAAVLEFRGAAGLPYVSQIDDAFLERLWQEVDVAGNPDNLPPGLQVVGGTQDPISITGKLGGGLGLLGLLALALYASRRKRR